MIRLCAAAIAIAFAALPALAETAPVKAAEVVIVKTAAAGGPLKLLVASPLGVERAKADAERLGKLFTEALHRPVTAAVVGNEEIAKDLAAGKGDLGWLSAMQYVEAAKASNLQAAPVAKLMRGGLPFYRSVIFALKSSKLARPKDLKGKRLAFVREDSAAGYLLPRQVLLGAGLTAAELKQHGQFLGDHASVCKAVADGKADAGATVSNDRAGGAIAGCVETLGPRASELRVISISDPIPNDVIAVRPGFAAAEFAALRTVLLGLDHSAEGKQALTDVFVSDAFVASEDGDFALLRDTLK